MSDEFNPRTALAEVAIAGARGVTAGILSDQPRRDVVRNSIVASLLFLAITIALVGLARLIGDNLNKGWPRLNMDLLTNGTSSLPDNAVCPLDLTVTLTLLSGVCARLTTRPRTPVVPPGGGCGTVIVMVSDADAAPPAAVKVSW